MRFPSWSAAHDTGQSGLNIGMKRLAVKVLSNHCKVFITSEKKLPLDLEKHRIQIPPSMIHDALYYSSLYFGDGGTMASESAVLGIPALYVSSITTGYLLEAEEKYELIKRYDSSNLGFTKALLTSLKLIKKSNLKDIWFKKQNNFLKDKIDVNSYLVNTIDDYCKQKNI